MTSSRSGQVRRPAETGPLRALSAVAERQRRLAGERELVQLGGADLGGAVALPPRGHEGAPDRALGVGRLVHLVEIGEEAGHAGGLDDAAHDPGPGLEAAEHAPVARATGRDPGAPEGEAGTDQGRPVRPHPGEQVGVPKTLAPPGLVDMSVEADGDDRDGVDHQCGAGARRRLFDQVQRRRPVDQGSHEGQQDQRQCMSALCLAGEREVAEQAVEEKSARRVDLGPCRPLRRDRADR